jgi:ribosome-associated translation inhibitor RaiA
MKDTDKLKEHVDQRFDRLEVKLDNHLERLSKAEVSIEWMRGHLKISTTFLLTLIGAALAAYFNWQ